MLRDPNDIMKEAVQPQDRTVDLTNHPAFLAAVEASYKQEAEILAATVIVGMVSRALSLCGPFGIAASHVLTGSEIPPEVLAQLQQSKATAPQTQDASGCQLSQLLQTAVPQLLSRLGK